MSGSGSVWRIGFGIAFALLPAASQAGTPPYDFGSFKGHNGAQPNTSLINVGGFLYGTTAGGGSANDGTVFKIGPTGETVLHSFSGHPDGAAPFAGLLNVGGMLYGTTLFGGGSGGSNSAGLGSIFKIDPVSGIETVVFAFDGESDNGAEPSSALTQVGQYLYGTTVYDSGQDGVGVLFRFDPATKAEKVLHTFGISVGDGGYPEGDLLDFHHTLYGTTYTGGAGDSGTIFKADPVTGTETVVYSFGVVTNDGASPQAGLIKSDGILYGTTAQGGANGTGTVFQFDPNTGVEKVLYSFGNYYSGDGEYPQAPLLEIQGALYGTTSEGGARGGGAVFEISSATGESVLQSLGADNGVLPAGPVSPRGLTNVGGELYGTSYYGGSLGYGTVFRLPK